MGLGFQLNTSPSLSFLSWPHCPGLNSAKAQLFKRSRANGRSQLRGMRALRFGVLPPRPLRCRSEDLHPLDSEFGDPPRQHVPDTHAHTLCAHTTYLQTQYSTWTHTHQCECFVKCCRLCCSMLYKLYAHHCSSSKMKVSVRCYRDLGQNPSSHPGSWQYDFPPMA